MKRVALAILILLPMLCVFAVNDSETLNVTGYLIKDTNTRMMSFNVMDYNGSSVSNGQYVPVSTAFVGPVPMMMFTWVFTGNLNYNRSQGVQLKFTLSSLKRTSSNSRIGYSYRFNADYTYLDGTYLGADGTKVMSISNSTIYKDTITPVRGSSVNTITGLSISGSMPTHNITRYLIYRYKLSATPTNQSDPGAQYLWSRTGTIAIAINENDYLNAAPGIYRASVTVEISTT